MKERGIRESARDQSESDFTPALRRLWRVDPGVLAVAFVASDGECIDYCSSLSPYDAKIAGAQLLIDVTSVAERFRALGWGETIELQLRAAKREYFVWRLDREYVLVVAVEAGATSRDLTRGIERAVVEIRREAYIDSPSWAAVESLSVDLRNAVGWDYAPTSFELEGERVEVADVLGRFVDEEEGGLVCFRVRTVDGNEITLARDEVIDRWIVLTEPER